MRSLIGHTGLRIKITNVNLKFAKNNLLFAKL